MTETSHGDPGRLDLPQEQLEFQDLPMATHSRAPDGPDEPYGFQDEPARPEPPTGRPAPPKKRRPKAAGTSRVRPPEPTNKKPQNRARQWVTLAAIMVPILGVAIFMAVRQKRQWSATLAAHRPQVEAYLAPGK